jgi:hypothetical protein
MLLREKDILTSKDNLAKAILVKWHFGNKTVRKKYIFAKKTMSHKP